MTDLKKAEDLYLRGFNGNYIKNETGITIQSLLGQLRSNGIKYSKEDIRNYQYDYILNNFSKDDVIEAYAWISKSFPDVEKAQRSKSINVLGCGFGEYPKVFKKILGDDVYSKIRNENWKLKQSNTLMDKYGVSNVFDKRVVDKFLSKDSLSKRQAKRTATMLARYGVEHPNQNELFVQKMLQSSKKTFLDKYGVDNPMKNPKVAAISVERRQATMLDRYGVANSAEDPIILNKIWEARKLNKTMNTSKPESKMHEYLVDIYGESDVIHDSIIDDRYPYRVDFYIKSRDLFIELNGSFVHQNHWFNKNDPMDVDLSEKYRGLMELRNSEGKPNSKYKRIIETWLGSDLEKRELARLNNLNYLVFWDGLSVKRDNVLIPRLNDFHDWLDEGMPDPKNWRKENTY